ncbi:hypothetical protein Y032_0197g1582 [Ancylostoma ceylanicum]|uniref:Uncharacterized protein n=2 Tax=Ancylostoma ceylanicum TaxID=53326 RepID=A0A016SP72_9BILA|nr:hypothetical protein Y032_0197g1582 [Ancylostoma ceylanicum]
MAWFAWRKLNHGECGGGVSHRHKILFVLLIESMRLRLSHVAILATFTAFVYYTDAQALNDPITQYIEGRLGNRRIFWCPSGYGYLAYCPQPTDWDNYNWCCTWPYMGSWKPSCCPFAIPTGAVVTIIIASIVLVAVPSTKDNTS